ncbi:hypothetical protein BGZ57DRAFT_913866 [Hyaloscypha finlandica]|nr:hypothetical protein BGZ57DRAFT_913866 [Hyaloscypha finlandica]
MKRLDVLLLGSLSQIVNLMVCWRETLSQVLRRKGNLIARHPLRFEGHFLPFKSQGFVTSTSRRGSGRPLRFGGPLQTPLGAWVAVPDRLKPRKFTQGGAMQ